MGAEARESAGISLDPSSEYAGSLALTTSRIKTFEGPAEVERRDIVARASEHPNFSGAAMAKIPVMVIESVMSN